MEGRDEETRHGKAQDGDARDGDARDGNARDGDARHGEICCVPKVWSSFWVGALIPGQRNRYNVLVKYDRELKITIRFRKQVSTPASCSPRPPDLCTTTT